MEAYGMSEVDLVNFSRRNQLANFIKSLAVLVPGHRCHNALDLISLYGCGEIDFIEYRSSPVEAKPEERSILLGKQRAQKRFQCVARFIVQQASGFSSCGHMLLNSLQRIRERRTPAYGNHFCWLCAEPPAPSPAY